MYHAFYCNSCEQSIDVVEIVKSEIDYICSLCHSDNWKDSSLNDWIEISSYDFEKEKSF